MFWKSRVLKVRGPERWSPGFLTRLAEFMDDLNTRYVLFESVRRERAVLATLTDDQLRDIGVHRADAEHESERSYFDMHDVRRD